MKVGDLVIHSDRNFSSMPKEHRPIGVVVRMYVDLDCCQVFWVDADCERLNHTLDSLEVISESR